MVLVAERQADVAVQRRLVQRDGAGGQLDGDHPQARGRRRLGRRDRARLGGRRHEPLGAERRLAHARVGQRRVLPHSQTCSAPKAAAERTIEPTLNGWPTESSSSASRAWVARRHSRFSRLTSTGRSWRGRPGRRRPGGTGEVTGESPRLVRPKIRPGAGGSRCARPGASPASPARPASGAASRRPRWRPATGRRGRRAPAGAASADSSSCRAGLPMRIGGLDQMPAKPRRDRRVIRG